MQLGRCPSGLPTTVQQSAAPRRVLAAGATPLLYSMGFVIATGCLHAVGIAVGFIHRWRWGQTLLRAAGGGGALVGVFFMWRAVT